MSRTCVWSFECWAKRWSSLCAESIADWSWMLVQCISHKQHFDNWQLPTYIFAPLPPTLHDVYIQQMGVFAKHAHNVFDKCITENKSWHHKSKLDFITLMHVIEKTTIDIIKAINWKYVVDMCGLADCPPTSKRFIAAFQNTTSSTFTHGIPTLDHIQAVLPRWKFISILQLFPLLMKKHAKCIRENQHPKVPDMIHSNDHFVLAPDRHFPWMDKTRATSSLGCSQAGHTARGTSSSIPQLHRAVPISYPRPRYRPCRS